MTRSFTILAAAALLSACARSPRVAAERPNATVSLRSAMVLSGAVTLSCRGGGFCRENTFPIEDTMAIDDAREDCVTRRGTVGSDPCPRDHAIVSCSGAGITVITYEQDDATEQADAVSKLTQICDMQEGTLERADGG